MTKKRCISNGAITEPERTEFSKAMERIESTKALISDLKTKQQTISNRVLVLQYIQSVFKATDECLQYLNGTEESENIIHSNEILEKSFSVSRESLPTELVRLHGTLNTITEQIKENTTLLDSLCCAPLDYDPFKRLPTELFEYIISIVTYTQNNLNVALVNKLWLHATKRNLVSRRNMLDIYYIQPNRYLKPFWSLRLKVHALWVQNDVLHVRLTNCVVKVTQEGKIISTIPIDVGLLDNIITAIGDDATLYMIGCKNTPFTPFNPVVGFSGIGDVKKYTFFHHSTQIYLYENKMEIVYQNERSLDRAVPHDSLINRVVVNETTTTIFFTFNITFATMTGSTVGIRLGTKFIISVNTDTFHVVHISHEKDKDVYSRFIVNSTGTMAISTILTNTDDDNPNHNVVLRKNVRKCDHLFGADHLCFYKNKLLLVRGKRFFWY